MVNVTETVPLVLPVLTMPSVTDSCDFYNRLKHEVIYTLNLKEAIAIDSSLWPIMLHFYFYQVCIYIAIHAMLTCT